MKRRTTAVTCSLLALVLLMQLMLPACKSKKNGELREPVLTEVHTTTQAETVPDTTVPETTEYCTETEKLIPETLAVSEKETTTVEAANPAMQKLMGEFGDIVQLCGFEYDEENDLFYSTMYPIQRYFGYNSLYDLMAYRVGMYYNTQKIYFKYGGKDWMLQIWKGQYGITVGAEIGLYNKPSDRLLTHYDCVSDDERIVMQFDVYKNGDYYFSRGPERHWWLTGFKLLDVAVFLQLNMVITIFWENAEIADAFEKGLNDFHITDMTYIRDGNTFAIDWTI